MRTARRFADAAAGAGADGILLLPPYLTEASGPGLVDYVREATRDDLPAIKGSGHAVSLVKAGVELARYSAGGVRPPLTAVTSEHRAELSRILAAGLAAVPAPAGAPRQ